MSTSSLALKIIRHRLRRAAASLKHGAALAAAPILFANGFPKSGTHLLTQILTGLASIGPAVNGGLPAIAMFDGASGAPRPAAAVLRDLSRLQPGDIAFGHLHALQELRGFFERQAAAVVFLYRDLRDVAVSHAHYVTEIATDHVHHAHYRALPDFDARLRTSILGRPEMGARFPDIRSRFEPYRGWLSAPGVLCLRFEDLIENQRVAIGKILDHVESFNFPAGADREGSIDLLRRAINPDHSPTFRSGKTGGWRGRYKEEHKKLFKEVAGELLIQLGYERDLSW